MLTKTKNAELGYAIDSLYYGIPDYNSYIKNGIAKLTRDQVNAAIRKHLRADRIQIVAVSANAEQLKQQLVGTGPDADPIQLGQARGHPGRRQDGREAGPRPAPREMFRSFR